MDCLPLIEPLNEVQAPSIFRGEASDLQVIALSIVLILASALAALVLGLFVFKWFED